MSVYDNRFNAVLALGDFWSAYVLENSQNGHLSERFSSLEAQIELAGHKNGWFTKDNVLHAIKQWSILLNKASLEAWLAPYPTPSKKPTVFIIMAGNIPLVGFHDFLTAYLAGAKVVLKAATNDKVLLTWIIDFLNNQAPSEAQEIEIVTAYKGAYDGLIATGSDNTARYFEHYFGHKPHIIRKNRNSIAVLSGHESQQDLEAMGEDIFRYYGLGCRSVSKIYVPKGYDFDILFKAVFKYKDLINYEKYSNNYDYNKAVYLMSNFKILDNGFLILKEDKSFSSPIGSLFYETYDSLENLNTSLQDKKELIQCIVGPKTLEGALAFGETQKPSLTDYADGVNTMEFIKSL